ncbi:MAG: hypothetical protein M1820_010845 [Bogoriella megaspora]|nr:MAG: hypothetical protein M1820_010845 [Bogoriella megaspora]
MALFVKEGGLGLLYPQLPPKRTGDITAIWAGGLSFGSCAIQIAIAAGLDVIATASERNHEYCKIIGAKWVFDYRSKTIIDDMARTLDGRMCVGVLDAWSRDSFPGKRAEVAMKVSGRSFRQTVMPSVLLPKEIPKELSLGYVSGVDDHVVSAVWRDWMPRALATGALKGKPELCPESQIWPNESAA